MRKKVSIEIGPLDQKTLHNSWRWILGWGVALIILGLLAISFATFTTLLSVVLLGALILAGGLFVIIDAFYFWRHRHGFFLRFSMGLLYSIVGLIFIFGPVLGSAAITLLLAVLFILLGISRIVSSTALQLPRWKWSLASGIITLILGVMILAEWPASGLFIIGLFVGIDLMLFGWAYVMVALFARGAKH